MLNLTTIPEGEQRSGAFSVTLNGQAAELYAVRVSALPLNRLWPGRQRDRTQTELSSLLTFAADEATEVCIKVPYSFEKAVIRPLSKKVRYTINEETIRFTLTQAGQYVVEVGDAHHVLHIFFDPVEVFSAAAGDTVLRYGAGTHSIGYVELRDNTTVLIDRGAVVYGAFYALGAENIRILGHGIIDGSFDERQDTNTLLVYDVTRAAGSSWEKENMRKMGRFTDDAEAPPKITYPGRYGSFLYRDRESFLRWMRYMDAVRSGTHFYACTNVEIRGVTYRNTAGLTLTSAGCSRMLFENIKNIGMWRYNSDGIDFYNCRDCVVRGCFMRNFDDCICVKGQVGWDTENSENILVENCVVWCDWGKSLEIGVDTVAPEIKNITYRNCDCIHHHAPVMDVYCDDRAKISGILFSDIRIEYSSYDTGCQYQYRDGDIYQNSDILHPFIMVGVGGCSWSNDGITGDISHVTFENISVVCEDGESVPPVVLSGRDAEHTVDSVVLRNVAVNGKPLTEAQISRNAYVGEVSVSGI